MKIKVLKKSNYEKYYKNFVPYVKKEKNQQYISIILTLGVSIFFLIFAINPTLSTIFRLKKDLKDSELVEKALDSKIKNMSSLFQQKQEIKDDIPLIIASVPDKPEAPILFAQIQSIANDSSVEISDENTNNVPLQGQIASESASINFQITAIGQYENVYTFLSNLSNMQRAIYIESISIDKSTKGEGIEASIFGKAFYRQ